MFSDAEARAAMLHAGVATLHETAGRRGLLAGVSLLVGKPFAGLAVTAWMPAGDNLALHCALESAPARSVVCVASSGGGRYGVLGELMLEAARAAGVEALVLADGVRDFEQLEAPPAVAASGISAHGTVKRRVRSIGEPIAIGGALVKPGDWVVGDRDGVCVVPAAAAFDVLGAAERRIEREHELRETLQTGTSSVVALGLRRPEVKR